jgi:hypothetical protein
MPLGEFLLNIDLLFSATYRRLLNPELQYHHSVDFNSISHMHDKWMCAVHIRRGGTVNCDDVI